MMIWKSATVWTKRSILPFHCCANLDNYLIMIKHLNFRVYFSHTHFFSYEKCSDYISTTYKASYYKFHSKTKKVKLLCLFPHKIIKKAYHSYTYMYIYVIRIQSFANLICLLKAAPEPPSPSTEPVCLPLRKGLKGFFSPLSPASRGFRGLPTLSPTQSDR